MKVLESFGSLPTIGQAMGTNFEESHLHQYLFCWLSLKGSSSSSSACVYMPHAYPNVKPLLYTVAITCLVIDIT